MPESFAKIIHFLFLNTSQINGSGHILIPFIIGIGAGWGMDTIARDFW